MSCNLRCIRCFMTGVIVTVAAYIGAVVYLMIDQSGPPVALAKSTTALTVRCDSNEPISLAETVLVDGPDGTSWRLHPCLAVRFDELLQSAADAGHNLGGWGWRDADQQVLLRRQNCGTTEHAIHHMPSSECKPPTARPGRSRHQAGLAFDFTVDGRLLTSRSEPAFVWLDANAAMYGLYNLPSEAWHWSVDGK